MTENTPKESKAPIRDDDFPHEHTPELVAHSRTFGNLLARVMTEKFNSLKGAVIETAKLSMTLPDDDTGKPTGKSIVCPAVTIMTALESFIAVEIASMSQSGHEVEAADQILGAVRAKVVEFAKNPELATVKANADMEYQVEEMKRKGMNIADVGGTIQ